MIRHCSALALLYSAAVRRRRKPQLGVVSLLVLMAAHILDFHTLPMWILWVLAGIGMAIFFAVILRVLPPNQRRRVQVGWPLVALLLLARTVVSRDPAGTLWMTAVISVTASGPLFWLGPMPADMPPATDPASRRHRQYRAVARRGRIAGLMLVALVVGVIVLSAVLIGGL